MATYHKATEFKFVVSTPSYNASTQRETQTFVRQHVNRRFKKNKNRPDMIVLQKPALAEYLTLTRRRSQVNVPGMDPDEESWFSMGSPSSIAPLLGASLPNPFARYPVIMGAKEHEVVHYIWASRQVVFQPFRDYWFSLGMVDPAAMHLVIANAAMHRKTLRTSLEDDILDLSHTTKAIESINERIADPNLNITDEILGAVIGLFCHDYLALRFDRCAIHLDGFQKMLEIRGGISSIDSISSIRMSIFWVEHNMCAAQDTTPQFPPPYHLLNSPYSTAVRSRGQVHCDEILLFSGISDLISHEVLDVLRGLSYLTVSFKERNVQKISLENPNFPGFAFYPELHKLLAMQSTMVHDRDKNAIQELIRLGGIFFLAEVRRSLSISPVMTNVQSAKLRSLLASESILWSQELDSLRTWAIVMAGCAASTDADRSWAVQSLTFANGFTVYKVWEDVYKIVSRMWWIDAICSLKFFTTKLLHGNEPRVLDHSPLPTS